MKKLRFIFLIVLFNTHTILFSQIKEERVRAQRTQQPDTKKIVKKGQIADEPNASNIKKDTLSYAIKDIEAVSDFKTSQLPPQKIDNLPKYKIYNNYIKVGYGNYDKLLIEGFYTYKLDENINLGGKFTHSSTTGLKNDFSWNSDQANNNLEIFLTTRIKKGALNASANYDFNKVNYYGIKDAVKYINPSIENNLQQKYNQFYIKGSYDVYENNYFDKTYIKAGYFWDAFNSKETFVDASILGDKSDISLELPIIGELNFGLEAVANIQFTTTEFNEISSLKTSYLTAGITPIIKLKEEYYTLKLGAGITYNGELEKGKSDIYFHPNALIEYKLKPELMLFAGIEGGIVHNTYGQFSKENPYLTPEQVLVPTNTKYKAYGGISGDLGKNFKYLGQAAYSKVDNEHFFTKNNYFNFPLNSSTQAYNHVNTFSSVYDNVNILSIKGELKFVAIENLSLTLTALSDTYTLNKLNDPYYKPNIKADITGNLLLLQQKLVLGTSIYFVGERKANDFEIDFNSVILSLIEKQLTLPSYVDINLNAAYKILPNLSVFVMGLNLFNSDYQGYVNYSVQGLQIVGGGIFKF